MLQPRTLSDDLADVARSSQQTRDAALLRATTELFVQETHHDTDELRRFEELAIHFLPKVAITERATVAERLALCPDAPGTVIRMLARDVIEVARPVLRRSPVLDTFDLLAVIAGTGPEHHRLIARRANLGDDVKRALRLTSDADVLGYLDNGASMRASAQPATSVPTPNVRVVSTAALPAPRGNAGAGFGVWQFLSLDRPTRLRVIADIALSPMAYSQASQPTEADRAFRTILNAAQVVGFVRKGQISELLGAIANGLELDPEAVAACLNDKSGEPLAILLKAMRLDEIQAQQVFLLGSPVGRDVQAFFPLTDLYAGMEHATAETLCRAWRIAAADRAMGHEQHFAENGDRRRSAVGDIQRRPQEDRKDISRRA